MSIESINIVKKIARRITSSDEGNIVILFDNVFADSNIPVGDIISINGFLKNLKGYSKITSTSEAQLPNIQIEDSEPERRMKTLDVEWKSQRKQLDLLVSANGQEWIEIGSISLIRQQGYPYRMYSLLDFFTDGLADEYGTNGKAGCRIIDVGYGLLTGNDLVTIHGSYLQEVVYKVTSQPTNIYLTCNGGSNNDNGDDGNDNGNDDNDNGNDDNDNDDNDNDNGEEEVKRIFSSNEPTQKEEGLEWIEISGTKNLVEHWFWTQHPVTSELCWKSSEKEQIITQQGDNETKASFIIGAGSDIYISSFRVIPTGNTNLTIKLDKMANFQSTNLKEFIAYGNNYQSESIYHHHQGSFAIIQVTATPVEVTNYHLSSVIEYCKIRPINSGGSGSAP